MDKAQEVKHLWRDAIKRKSLSHTTLENTLDDVKFLLDRIETLERDLADSLSPVSSRMGSLTMMEDGVIHYRINGLFIPISVVVRGLRILQDLKLSGQKVSKTLEKEQADLFKFLEDAFYDPTAKTRLEEGHEAENGQAENE
jgi:hypothetical protein